MNPNGWAQTLAFSISRAVNDRPREGISRHFHTVVVRRGQTGTWNNDERIYHPDGSIIDVRMPRVDQSYEHFVELAAVKTSRAACATC